MVQDIERAHKIGIQGVPFFLINNKYGLSGAQPVEVICRGIE
ncbi:MAG: DsbA family protein [Gracilimonas sp.]|nr:DsbA family protein [Gracilimonas sp.]